VQVPRFAIAVQLGNRDEAEFLPVPPPHELCHGTPRRPDLVSAFEFPALRKGPQRLRAKTPRTMDNEGAAAPQ